MDRERTSPPSDVEQPLGLLVSVRSLAEAEIAMSCQVDILDVKEPNQGALGRASDDVLSEIATACSGRCTLSAALGELSEYGSDLPEIPDFLHGFQYLKCGLAGCGTEDWRHRVAGAWDQIRTVSQPVAVAYADHVQARSPSPWDLLEHAGQHGVDIMLIDTWSKSGNSTLDYLSHNDLVQLKKRASVLGIRFVLAGSLQESHLQSVAETGANWIGIRGAVCEGKRSAGLSLSRLQSFRKSVNAVNRIRLQASM